LVENLRISSYGGKGSKIVQKSHMIFDTFPIAVLGVTFYLMMDIRPNNVKYANTFT